MDIKTASELTGESRTKLAQAKSKGLVRTLISEALTAQKNWEEIKDSLLLEKIKCRYSYLNKPFYGYSTDRQGIISDICSLI